MINLSRKPYSTKLMLSGLLLALTAFVIYHLSERTQLSFTTTGSYRHILELGGKPLKERLKNVLSPLKSNESVKMKKKVSTGSVDILADEILSRSAPVNSTVAYYNGSNF